MNIRGMAAWSCLTAVMAFGVAACGDDDDDEGGGGGGASSEGGTTVTVYSSLPLQGASRPQSEGVIQGIKLALQQKGGRCGDYGVKYESLDDSTAAAAQWEAGQTSANARKAAQDDSAVAYIGEFNSGASAISIPITNEGGLLQVSPANTAVGLTKELGAEPGEPDKYYPSGERTYGRVVPADFIQGAAQAQYMKDEGVTSVYILDDAEVYGKGVAKNTRGRRQGSSGSRSRVPTPGTATQPTTARWRRRSSPAAPTLSSPAALSTTTRRSSTRTCTRRCRTPSCSARTA